MPAASTIPSTRREWARSSPGGSVGLTRSSSSTSKAPASPEIPTTEVCGISWMFSWKSPRRMQCWDATSRPTSGNMRHMPQWLFGNCCSRSVRIPPIAGEESTRTAS